MLFFFNVCRSVYFFFKFDFVHSFIALSRRCSYRSRCRRRRCYNKVFAMAFKYTQACIHNKILYYTIQKENEEEKKQKKNNKNEEEVKKKRALAFKLENYLSTGNDTSYYVETFIT